MESTWSDPVPDRETRSGALGGRAHPPAPGPARTGVFHRPSWGPTSEGVLMKGTEASAGRARARRSRRTRPTGRFGVSGGSASGTANRESICCGWLLGRARGSAGRRGAGPPKTMVVQPGGRTGLTFELACSKDRLVQGAALLRQERTAAAAVFPRSGPSRRCGRIRLRRGCVARRRRNKRVATWRRRSGFEGRVRGRG